MIRPIQLGKPLETRYQLSNVQHGKSVEAKYHLRHVHLGKPTEQIHQERNVPVSREEQDKVKLLGKKSTTNKHLAVQLLVRMLNALKQKPVEFTETEQMAMIVDLRLIFYEHYDIVFQLRKHFKTLHYSIQYLAEILS